MNPDQVDAEIRELAAARRLPERHLAQWLTLDAGSRAALANLARGLRFRTGQIVTALDLLDEIAVRERTTVAAVLERPEIRAIANGHGGRPSRAAAMLEALRAIRYPRIRRMQEQLRAEIAALKLPRGISIDLPKDLGSDELSISLRVKGATELSDLLAALERARPGLTRVIEILGGMK